MDLAFLVPLFVLTVLNTASAVAPEIILAPMNMTVGLGHAPLTLPCHILGRNIYWEINGELYGSRNLARFRDMGITVSNAAYEGDTVTAEATVRISNATNNTVIICEAQSGGNLESSAPATIFITDVPLPPSPEFLVVNKSTVRVQWEAPFTWNGFPITNYTISFVNETSEEVLAHDVLSADIFSYSITENAPPCTNISFSVWANNSIGISMSGTVHGAFPVRPGIFLNSPRREVTFSQDHSPILTINFTFPFLCFYHNATYHVVIEDHGGMLAHMVGPEIRHWKQGDSLVTIQLREGLLLNTMYRASIRVRTLAGEESISFSFDTLFNMTLLSTDTLFNMTLPSTDADDHAVPIAVTCVVTTLLMALFVSIAVCTVYVYRRSVKRNRECTNTTELSSKPMVHNPIYEGGVIYEEIPDVRSLSQKKKELEPSTECGEEGYVSIANRTSNRNVHFPTLGMCDTAGLEKGQQDETYTTMNSVGPLLKNDSSMAIESQRVLVLDQVSSEVKNEQEDRYVLVNAKT